MQHHSTLSPAALPGQPAAGGSNGSDARCNVGLEWRGPRAGVEEELPDVSRTGDAAVKEVQSSSPSHSLTSSYERAAEEARRTLSDAQRRGTYGAGIGRQGQL